jgi:branched-chain amino acid transport system substrate-binding protein
VSLSSVDEQREVAMRLERLVVYGAAVLAIVTAAPATQAEVRIGLAAPLTGPLAWAGEGTQRGAEIAVSDLNQIGGVLGEQIEMITADDYCDGAQAVAAAKKLVEAEVAAVLGHDCSGAAIPASEIYADADTLMISTFATNPKLTEKGFTNVFRMVGRDDVQSEMAAELLAERWANREIAIVHDGKPYGKDLAEEAKKRLNERGIAESVFEAIEPGRADYSDVVLKMRAMGVDVLFFGGYLQEIGLLARQAHDLGYDWQLITGDGVGTEDFALIAGPGSEEPSSRILRTPE